MGRRPKKWEDYYLSFAFFGMILLLYSVLSPKFFACASSLCPRQNHPEHATRQFFPEYLCQDVL